MESRTNLAAGIIIFFILLGIPIVAFLIIQGTGSSEKASASATSTPSGPVLGAQNLVVPTPTPTIEPKSTTYPLNKSFDLPIKDAQGQTVGTVKYLIKEYEFTNKVTVNNAYNGLLKDTKELLVFHAEIKNDTNLAFRVFAADKIRLVKGSETLIAPDFPKEAADVRPKSTVEAKVGFILDKNNESLLFRLGEQDGDTEELTIPRT